MGTSILTHYQNLSDSAIIMYHIIRDKSIIQYPTASGNSGSALTIIELADYFNYSQFLIHLKGKLNISAPSSGYNWSSFSLYYTEDSVKLNKTTDSGPARPGRNGFATGSITDTSTPLQDYDINMSFRFTVSTRYYEYHQWMFRMSTATTSAPTNYINRFIGTYAITDTTMANLYDEVYAA